METDPYAAKTQNFFELYKTHAREYEGERLFPYMDTTGNLTIGIGHNLTSKGISQKVSDQIFVGDYQEVLYDLVEHFPWWTEMDDARKLAIFDLRFNLGPAGFRRFSTTLGHCERGDWAAAAAAFRSNRRYFAQIKRRAEVIARLLETGSL